VTVRAPHIPSLFARDGDLARLGELFRNHRLVTLKGPGGIGKTSLARGMVATVDRATFVDWSEADGENRAMLVLAQAAGVRGAVGERLLESVARALGSRTPDLLVLDNCETVIEDAARIAGRLLGAVPGLRILATSRELLQIDEEVVFTVNPLALEGAMALFVERARRARPTYSPDADTTVIEAIARKLEGIPLAIELAAARMSALDAKSVLERLDARFELLRGQRRSSPERHRTLEQAIAGSWELLSETEQAALTQCAVFRGGFTLTSAQAVLELEKGSPSILDLVQSLVAKSLVHTTEGAGGDLRFHLFDSIREFAVERLSEAETTNLWARHRAHFLAFGSEWEAKYWHGVVDNVGRLAAERENLLTARENALEDQSEGASADVVRSAIAVHPIFVALGPLPENPSLRDRAAMDTRIASLPPGLRARFLLVRGRAEQLLGNRVPSRADFEAAATAAREAGDDQLVARALVHLATADRSEGNFDRARDRFEAALARFEASGDEPASAVVLSALGALDLLHGELERARSAVARAAEMQRRSGERATLGMILVDLGIIEQELGLFDSARSRLEEARRIQAATENRRSFAVATGYLGNVELEQRDEPAAAEHYREAIGILEKIGDVKFAALFAAALASIEGDAARFDAIETKAGGSIEPRIGATIALFRARWELRAALPGARERVEELRARAVGLERESDDVRFALRLLSASLKEKGESPEVPTQRAGPSLRIGKEGATFDTPSGEHGDLSRRESARRILLSLVRRRLEAPGEPLTPRELVEAGWPGERIGQAAAKNRLHVTLAKLRELGLRDVLLHCDSGHFLDPSLSIVVER